MPVEFNNTKSPLRQIREYLSQHPKIPMINSEGQSEVDENYLGDSQKINIHKYGSSSFRHKDNKQGIVKDYMNTPEITDNMDTKYDNEENLPLLPPSGILNERPVDDDMDYDPEGGSLLNQEPMMYDGAYKSNREMRSKDDVPPPAKKTGQSKKKNLSNPIKYGIYDYQNIKMSKNRLLHDLNNLPWDILRDTYYKNRESQLRKSKFEQRDITSHIDKTKQNEELKNIIDQEKKSAENTSFTLWDLESEKELQDKENGYWRGKRQTDYKFSGIRKITSVGAILKPINTTKNAVDIVFITYWQPLKYSPEEMSDQEIQECLKEKLANDQAHAYTKNTAKEQKDLYINECKNEQESLKQRFQYFDEIYRLSLGQMTVYRVTIECLCDVQKLDEKCAKFLPQDEQVWSMYLGKFGDGVFRTRN